MNQILMDSSTNVGKNKPNKSNKATKVFAILLIIFALSLIGVGGYRIYKNYYQREEKEQVTEKPKIEAVYDEEEGVLNVTVTHIKAIERVVYSWNNSSDTEIKGTGENTMSVEIQVPLGTNNIKIKAFDIDDVFGEYSTEVTSETGEDITEPEITLENTEDKKIKITATDNVAMQYVNYSWNGEDITRVDAKPAGAKSISFEIDVRKDKNTLTVIAVDTSNRSKSETRNYTGVTEPTIQFSTNNDNSEVTIVISHENGIKGVSGNLNGKDFTVRSFEEGSKKVSFTLGEDDGIKEGSNTLEVSASSVDLTEKTEKHTWTKATTVNLVDTSDTGTSSTSSSTAVTTEPKITITQNASNKSKVNVGVSYNAGIKKVTINVNNEEYPQELNGVKSEEFELELDSGSYNISVKAEGTDGITKTETKTLTVN